jgi:hypothetical protein
VIKGHVVKDCWYRESNRGKRLAEFKVKSDRRNSEEVAARIKSCNNNIQEYLDDSLNISTSKNRTQRITTFYAFTLLNTENPFFLTLIWVIQLNVDLTSSKFIDG